MSSEMSRRSTVGCIGSFGMLAFGRYALAAPTGLSPLRPSDAVKTGNHGQVIEWLDISAPGTGIEVRHDNVTIRGCRIRHDPGAGVGYGILASGVKSLTIEDCEIINMAAPPTGAAANERQHNIRLNRCKEPTIHRITLRDGSTGVYLDSCLSPSLSMVEGFNMRGPFPRGQLVQFSNCQGGSLEDFSCFNDPDVSWPEDVVSVYRSPNVFIRRGYLDGCNARSGVGVMIEQKESMNVTVEDVDTLHMFNGSFSAASGATGTKFRRCRTRDGVKTSPRVNGSPPSNYLMFASWGGGRDAGSGIVRTTGTVLEDCAWYNMPNAANVAWDKVRFLKLDVQQRDFTPRQAFKNILLW